MKNIIEEFNHYFNDLVNGKIDRYGIIFKTSQNKYYFDTGTGKVLQCSDVVYELLHHLFLHEGKIVPKEWRQTTEDLLAAMKELKAAIKQEHIFMAKELTGFQCEHKCNLEQSVGKVCTQLILEVTDECNLRCKYCVYEDDTKNFRAFGHKKMSFETAKKAMDYVLKIAPQDTMYLAFYGGEPLLNYSLIKQCTEYFSEQYTGEELILSFTSNLTLLTQEMAQYFSEHKFSITCSLDGDQQTHDQNRVYANQKGSFHDTIRGLRMLVEAYGEHTELININMVVTRPYSNEKFDRIQKFFDDLDWLPKNVAIRTSYEGIDQWDENTSLFPNYHLIEGNYNFRDDLEEWICNAVQSGKNKNSLYTSSALDSGMTTIHQRRITDKPMEQRGLNGCCMPGSRRLYVTVDGDYAVCERIGDSPYIGNVDTGIDIEQVRKYYVEQYEQKSLENCNNCWCVNLCGLCYARAYDENGLDMKRKKVLCEGERYSNYRYLQKYHILLEKCPEILQEYANIKYI